MFRFKYFQNGAWHVHPKSFRLMNNAANYAQSMGYFPFEVISEESPTTPPKTEEKIIPDPADFVAKAILSMKLSQAEAQVMWEREFANRQRQPVLRFLRKIADGR